ncbi:MAG: hypothetical protein JKY96_02165 [Phycisphaerales bacterium]|nr:hypothetical protein [Phycisphaerales bacterium]
MHHILRFGLLCTILISMVFASQANACLWDRDTLAMEAKDFPGITEIITGRFDRFPPLYYEMRLDRVATEVESDPNNLDLYDDAAVACDRLGRSDEAIEWMTKKRAMLDSLTPTGGDHADHEYRYLANLGTFHIHRWLKNGANREDMADVQRSRELIAAAIELNPDAHFGRERYQLLAIEWILNLDEIELGEGQSLIHQIEGYDSWFGSRNNELASLGYEDAADGLMGLIALGNAWQSIDIYYALGFTLGDQNDAVLSNLSMNRVRELVEAGSQSLLADFDYEQLDRAPVLIGIENEYKSEISDWYTRARIEADDWIAQRNAFALERLKQGQHPDTHPDFWDEWTEQSAPPEFPSRPSIIFNFLAPVLVVSAILLLLAISGVVIAFKIRARS